MIRMKAKYGYVISKEEGRRYGKRESPDYIDEYIQIKSMIGSGE
jgi:hypothetical protein